ncbi:hypothetical protein C8R43DRAFT_1005495 [Mycena crocata]|nr:hypothetical protein C8R43DRAFT_1005495 [Mycena crocata]
MACPLPNELVLEIISCLCLKSLIATRGVCKLWRRLLVHADINPPRRDLLDLYLSFVSSPTYESARQWSLQNLYSFDRQAYVDCLLEQHNYLPAHFQLWVLEWPEWAIIGCAWPGLPPVTCNLDGVAIAEGHRGQSVWLIISKAAVAFPRLIASLLSAVGRLLSRCARVQFPSMALCLKL